LPTRSHPANPQTKKSNRQTQLTIALAGDSEKERERRG
jgi:hypothetical protein